MLKQHKKFTKKELKKDPLVLFAAEAVDFLRNEWVKIASTAGTVVLVIAISLFIVHVKEKNDASAYDAAFAAVAGNAPEADELLQKAAFGAGSRSAEPLLMLGNRYAEVGDIANAEKCYTRYIKKFGKDAVTAFTAYHNLGAVYEQKGDFTAAANTYVKYTQKFADVPYCSMMNLSAGKAFLLANNTAAAKDCFQKVADGENNPVSKQEALSYLETLE